MKRLLSCNGRLLCNTPGAELDTERQAVFYISVALVCSSSGLGGEDNECGNESVGGHSEVAGSFESTFAKGKDIEESSFCSRCPDSVAKDCMGESVRGVLSLMTYLVVNCWVRFSNGVVVWIVVVLVIVY